MRRVQPVDSGAERRLRMLWALIGPFEGLVGTDALKAAVQRAEKSAPHSQDGPVQDRPAARPESMSVRPPRLSRTGHRVPPAPVRFASRHGAPRVRALAGRGRSSSPRHRSRGGTGANWFAPASGVRPAPPVSGRAAGRSGEPGRRATARRRRAWRHETGERAAGESDAEALFREGARLAPPPAPGEAGPPILLRVDRRFVEAKRPAGHAALAGRRTVEQDGMPSTERAPERRWRRRAHRRRRAAKANGRAQAEVEPVLIAEPQSDTLQGPIADLSGAHPESGGRPHRGLGDRVTHMRARIGGQRHESPAPGGLPGPGRRAR